MPSRRDFLRYSSVVAACGLPGLLRSAGAAEPRAPRALVDWHSHYVSQAEVRYFESRTQPPRLIRPDAGVTQLDNVTTVSFAGGRSEFSASDIRARLAHLDANGIRHQLLTHTVALGLDATIPLEELRPLYRAAV